MWRERRNGGNIWIDKIRKEFRLIRKSWGAAENIGRADESWRIITILESRHVDTNVIGH